MIYISSFLRNALQWDDYESSVFKDVFFLIFFSKSPLSTQDISDILGLPADTTSNLLSRLQLLVSFEAGQSIKIRHTSFYDYLVSCVDERWRIDVDVQRRGFVNNRSDRMSELLRSNIYELETSLAFNKDVPDLDECVRKNNASFLRYICYNWFNYIRDVPYSQDLCE